MTTYVYDKYLDMPLETGPRRLPPLTLHEANNGGKTLHRIGPVSPGFQGQPRMTNEQIDAVKNVADAATVPVTLATVMGWMPNIAALLTAGWMIIRIWESATGRRLLRAVCARCAAWWER